jgi:GNAT superfamily N-acetyltransferase
VELREATSEDADACLVVQRRSAVVGYAHIFAQDLYPFPDDVVRAEWVRRHASEAHVVVASESGELIGTVSARSAWVEALFVVPDSWGTGVAGRLLDRAVELIAASGATTARLDVMADNVRARRFYERRGWAPDGRTSVSPFPPYPKILGYRLDLTRMPIAR